MFVRAQHTIVPSDGFINNYTTKLARLTSFFVALTDLSIKCPASGKTVLVDFNDLVNITLE